MKPLQAASNNTALMQVQGVGELCEGMSKINFIVNIHTTLLADLKERVGSWSDCQVLGDVFLKMVAFAPFLLFHGN